MGFPRARGACFAVLVKNGEPVQVFDSCRLRPGGGIVSRGDTLGRRETVFPGVPPVIWVRQDGLSGKTRTERDLIKALSTCDGAAAEKAYRVYVVFAETRRTQNGDCLDAVRFDAVTPVPGYGGGMELRPEKPGVWGRMPVWIRRTPMRAETEFEEETNGTGGNEADDPGASEGDGSGAGTGGGPCDQ